MKKIILFCIVFTFLCAYHMAFADVSFERINNRYVMRLSENDTATLYFSKDSTLMLIPSVWNEEFVHICWAEWNFDEFKQILEIKKAGRCRVMNGIYHVEYKNHGLILTDGNKTHVLKSFGK